MKNKNIFLLAMIFLWSLNSNVFAFSSQETFLGEIFSGQNASVFVENKGGYGIYDTYNFAPRTETTETSEENSENQTETGNTENNQNQESGENTEVPTNPINGTDQNPENTEENTDTENQTETENSGNNQNQEENNQNENENTENNNHEEIQNNEEVVLPSVEIPYNQNTGSSSGGGSFISQGSSSGATIQTEEIISSSINESKNQKSKTASKENSGNVLEEIFVSIENIRSFFTTPADEGTSNKNTKKPVVLSETKTKNKKSTTNISQDNENFLEATQAGTQENIEIKNKNSNTESEHIYYSTEVKISEIENLHESATSDKNTVFFPITLSLFLLGIFIFSIKYSKYVFLKNTIVRIFMRYFRK